MKSVEGRDALDRFLQREENPSAHWRTVFDNKNQVLSLIFIFIFSINFNIIIPENMFNNVIAIFDLSCKV